MQDVVYLDRLEQAETLLKPKRVELLRRLAEPRSCTELGAELGDAPQKVYYHVKKLEAAGLVDRVGERRVRAITEGIYQARARSYWLSPQLVGRIGGSRRAGGELSLGFLLDLAEEIQADVARLADGETEVPSLGLSAEVRITPERREAFLCELRTTFEDLLTRYGGRDGESFRVALTCYPKGAP
jgi:DNA-binding transcriptional ArsR family regulator